MPVLCVVQPDVPNVLESSASRVVALLLLLFLCVRLVAWLKHAVQDVCSVDVCCACRCVLTSRASGCVRGAAGLASRCLHGVEWLPHGMCVLLLF